MKNTKYCIIIGGLPACGKTSFAHYLSYDLSLPLMTQDGILSRLRESLCFGCERDGTGLRVASLELLYDFAQTNMCVSRPFIIESEFCDESVPPLYALLSNYGFEPVTVRFGGELAEVYKRFRALRGESEKETTLAKFCERVQSEGYGRKLTSTSPIVVNATELREVSYKEITDAVADAIEQIAQT